MTTNKNLAHTFQKERDLFFRACKEGWEAPIQILWEQGVDIHIGAEQALRWAAARGNLKVIKWLVAHGADIHAGNEDALHWAAGNGNLEIVKWLVSQGADVEMAVKIAQEYDYPQEGIALLEGFL